MKHSRFNENQGCRFWLSALFLLGFCVLISGCAEFFEDYQYNPAGPLYQSSSNY